MATRPTMSTAEREQSARALVVALERRRRRRRTGDQPHQVNALALARFLGIRPYGSADSRKRGVRELVRHLRSQEGVPIVATGAGYYIAEEPGDLVQYRQFLQRMGLSHLAESARSVQTVAADAIGGQMRLFA